MTVPDLGGRQCAEARAALAVAGWTVKPVRWRVAGIEDFGKIVAQDPPAGTVAPKKGQISVQVAGPVRPC
jgi:beta-lactam-binding protein with PASTA domain